jgi:Domain of unknown function (DUF4397)
MKLTQLWQHVLLRVAVLGGVLAVCVLWGGLGASVSADSMAFVRVVHASPGAGPVDVYVDGSKLLSDFKFASVTGYVSVPAGPHKIQVAPTGKGASAAVITQSVSVNAGMAYTVAALGTTSSGFSLEAFADDNTLASGMAKVRVYHLSPDAGPVDVAAGGNTVITGLTYQKASGYLAVPPGSYTFKVTATQASATVPVAADLKQGTVTSVFALGLLKGSPKLQFVPAQVSGVPGMPGTGSDPNAPAAAGNTPPPGWFFLLIVAVAGASTTLVARRLHATRSRG